MLEFELDGEFQKERLPRECSLASPILTHSPLQCLGLLPCYTRAQLKEKRLVQTAIRNLNGTPQTTRLNSHKLWRGIILDQPSCQSPIDLQLLTDKLRPYYAAFGYNSIWPTQLDMNQIAKEWSLAVLITKITLFAAKTKHETTEEQPILPGFVINFLGNHVVIKVGDIPSGRLGQNHIYLVNYADWLGFQKLCTQRAHCLLLATFQNLYEPEIVPPVQTLLQMYQIFDLIIWKTGNEGISLVKQWEPMVLCEIGDKLGDPFGLEDMFKKTVRAEWETTARTLRVTPESQQLRALLKSCKNEFHQYQLFGCFKHFGYPRVSSRACLASVQKASTKPVAFDSQKYLLDQADIKCEFYRRYKEAKHEAPGLDLSNLHPLSYLKRVLTAGAYPNIHHKDYTPFDWLQVKFTESIAWPVRDTLSSFLGDKAITVSRTTWEKQAQSQGGIIIPETESRLLLKFLQEEDSSVRQIVNDAMEIYDDEDQRVIAVKVKEMELKPSGRGFGLMTFRLRLLQVLREAIAKKTKSLFPEITMTESDIGLKKRKFRLGKGSQIKRGTIRIKKSLDIEKFCSSQRQLQSMAVYESLDELLGTGLLFTRVHEIFRKTWVLDGSGFKPPDIDQLKAKFQEARERGEEIPTVWADGIFVGMKGGIEGLCQYVWSICLLLRVDRVLNTYGVTHTILAQGDNVVLDILVPILQDPDGGIVSSEYDRIPKLSSDIDQDLKTELQQSGLTLKIEETFSSQNLSFYGKDMNCPHQLSLSLKKAASTAIISSEQYQDVPTFLSGLTTSMESISEQCNQKVPVHQFGMVLAMTGWTLLAQTQTWKGWNYPYQQEDTDPTIRLSNLQKDPEENMKLNIKPLAHQEEIILDFLMTQSFLGSALGGLSFPHIIDLEKRGVGDYISHRLSICKKALLSPELSQRTKGQLSSLMNLPINTEPDFSKLFDSPFSLNLCTEEDASLAIKRISRKFLRQGIVKNTQIKDQIAIMDEGIKELDSVLSKGDPINPRLFHNLRDITDAKEAEMFVDKFATARTMRNYALKQELELSLLGTLERKSIRKMNYTLWRYQRQKSTIWSCSRQRAQDLRQLTWKRNLIGVTSPSPLEALETKIIDPVIWESSQTRNQFHIMFIQDSGNSQWNSITTTRGALVPFIGTTTAPVVAKAYLELKGNPKTNKTLALLSCRESMILRGGNLDILILGLCSQALDLDLTSLPALRQLEHASAVEGLRDGQRKETMSLVGPTNYLSHVTHRVHNRVVIQEKHVNLADMITMGYCRLRRDLSHQHQELGKIRVEKIACTRCFADKSRVFLDLPIQGNIPQAGNAPDIAELYFTTWGNLTRLSMIPDLSTKEATLIQGRLTALNTSSGSEDTTKFHTIKSDLLERIDPVLFLQGYLEGFLVATCYQALHRVGSLYQISSISKFEALVKGRISDLRWGILKDLGFLFESETSLTPLLDNGLIPYIPRAIPTTAPETMKAAVSSLEAAYSREIMVQPEIAFMPCELLDESNQQIFDRAVSMVWVEYANSRTSPTQTVYCDIDLESHFDQWTPPLRTVAPSTPFSTNLISKVISRGGSEPSLDEFSKPKPLKDPKTINMIKGVGTNSLFKNSGIPDLLPHLPNLLLVLGGGLGGCAIPYLQRNTKMKVIFCTLRSEREHIGEEAGSVVPPELLIRNLEDRIVSRALLEGEICDVTIKAHRRAILQHVIKYWDGSSPILILNEIETGHSLTLTVLTGLKKLLSDIYTYGPVYLVSKFNFTSTANLIDQIYQLSAPSVKTTLIRSEFNSITGTEVYVLTIPQSQTGAPRWLKREEVTQFLISSNKFLIQAKNSLRIYQLRGALPSSERQYLEGKIRVTLFTLGIVSLTPRLDLKSLFRFLKFGLITKYSWEEKQGQRFAQSSDDTLKVYPNQHDIMILLVSSWLLRRLVFRNWILDVKAIRKHPIQIVHVSGKDQLLPLGESHPNPLISLRLTPGKFYGRLEQLLNDVYQIEFFLEDG